MNDWLAAFLFIVLPHVLIAIKVFWSDAVHTRAYVKAGRVSGPYRTLK